MSGSRPVLAGCATILLARRRRRSQVHVLSPVLSEQIESGLVDAHASSGSSSRSGRYQLTIASVVQRLYDNFNSCDPNGTAECFTEDIVYEDLLLGNSTIVQSREEFRELIQSHPVFVGASACKAFNMPTPDLQVKVDTISEDLVRSTVGVEWHVEVNGESLVLGRGLSFMTICPKTGLICKATDIAEAPWRSIGLVLAPFARGLRILARMLGDGSIVSVLTSVFLLSLFMDRSSLDIIRHDIDTLDDFRGRLDESSIGLQDILVGGVGRGR